MVASERFCTPTSQAEQDLLEFVAVRGELINLRCRGAGQQSLLNEADPLQLLDPERGDYRGQSRNGVVAGLVERLLVMGGPHGQVVATGMSGGELPERLG